MKASAKNRCATCGKCFAKPALLRRHLIVHSEEKPFACNSCSSKFTQKSSLHRHINIKHNRKPNDDSQVAQQALAALKLLQATHTQIDDTNGSTDKQTTLEEQPPSCQVVQLKDALHPNGEVNLLTTQRILRPHLNGRCYYVCEYCAKEFSKTYDLIRHRRTHTKEWPYPCSSCLKRFPTQTKLNEHKKSLHATRKTHDCSKCNTSYNLKSELHTHLAEEHPELAYSCVHCSRTFLTKAACEAHEKLEADAQVERLKQLLPQPVISERSYKCIYCQKQFKRKFNCRTHMLTHLKRLLGTEQASRHSCMQCGKSFKSRHDLERHLLIHSKLKMHTCMVCQKKFTLKLTLSRHLQTHQANRNPINCQVCGKSFASKTSLQLHLRLHTGDRPFKCEICFETFRTSGHKLEHMRGERHKNAKYNALIL